MGLDISHDCWHGAYTAFRRYRNKLAELTGVPLALMEGFYDQGELTANFQLWSDRKGDAQLPLILDEAEPCLPIPWELLKRDPIHTLLNHSDCDGTIPWRKCKALADRLEGLLPDLEKEGDGGGHIGSYADKTRLMIEGLRLAYDRQETVRFG
jgi:hypothetical protein